jgi:zinc protease
LTQEVRGKRGWSYGAYSSLAYDRKRQAFSMWTFPKAADAAACIELELSLLQSWCESGITEEELVAAQRYLVQSRAFACDTTSKRIGLVMDEVLGDLPSGYHERYVEEVGSVTLAQANAAVRRRISLENLTIAVVGTHSEIGADVRRAIEGLSSERVVPFDTD